MATCIQVSNLTKCYGATVALSSLSLEIGAGEVFGVLGPNGAGKSTLLSMLTGLVPPTAGSVTIFGKDLHKGFLEIAPRMGVVMERPAFYNHLSARRNLSICARLSRCEVTLDKVLDTVGLVESQNRKVGTFSQGMRQRLALAQALLAEPSLLILDEPATGLDAEASRETLGMLRQMADLGRVTIVMSSHMMHEVEMLCDRVAILNQGQLISCDKIDSLVSYDTTEVEVLLDAPEGAARRLADLDWVESCEVRPGKVRVELRDGNVHQLTAHLVGLGFRISGVIPRKRTLNDYFLKVLGS